MRIAVLVRQRIKKRSVPWNTLAKKGHSNSGLAPGDQRVGVEMTNHALTSIASRHALPEATQSQRNTKGRAEKLLGKCRASPRIGQLGL